MIVPIIIDHQSIADQFHLDKESVDNIIDYAIKEITAQFAVQWEKTAMNELHSTRNRYVQNLKIIDEGRMKGAVMLDYSKDPLIQMIEEGASSFDMKEGFEKSSKKTMKKNGGWYLTIPFSIGTPGTLSDNFSTIMPSEVYNVVKNKVVNPTTNRSAGLMESEIPEQYKAKQIKAVIPESKSFKAYQHKNSIFEGVYKSNNKTTGQSTYGSFRRVSDVSDPSSWIHPGLQVANIAEKALSEFESNIEPKLTSAMDSALSYFGIE